MMESDEKPVVIAWLSNPASILDKYAPSKVYQQLFEQVFAPDEIRSHVITLHLYVEYWLDKILDKLKVKDQGTFYKNMVYLNDKGFFQQTTFENIETINRIRNLYAHELDLESVTPKVLELIKKLKLNPLFHTTDKDLLRPACVQTMFELEATYNLGGKIPDIKFPDADIAKKLKEDSKILWHECQILRKEKSGYIEKFVIKCPRCNEGEVIREKDNTPGHKESSMNSCAKCGLTGDGSYFVI